VPCCVTARAAGLLLRASSPHLGGLEAAGYVRARPPPCQLDGLVAPRVERPASSVEDCPLLSPLWFD
jgi:hypothetical protein